MTSEQYAELARHCRETVESNRLRAAHEPVNHLRLVMHDVADVFDRLMKHYDREAETQRAIESTKQEMDRAREAGR